MMQLWKRIQQTKAWRAWKRFGDARGNLLASGIAFYGFFSIFPAVAIAAVVFGFVLRNNPELLTAVGDSLNRTLPGFIKSPAHPEGLVELKAPAVSVLTLGGLIALVGLVLSGVGWIGAMRDGIRSLFGAPGSPGNLITDKLRDLGVLVTLGAGVLVSAVVTSVLGAGAGGLSRAVGLGDNTILVTLVGLIVGFVVDVGVMVLLLRVLSGVPLPWKDVRQGAIVGGVGLTILKVFGVQLIGNATKNPLFGSLVLVIGLLFWLNLIAKLILLSAAWTANDVDDNLADLESASGVTVSDDEVRAHRAQPAAAAGGRAGRTAGIDLTDERARAVAGIPTFGERTSDRASLTAGAVLGATAAIALATVGRTLRSVLSRR